MDHEDYMRLALELAQNAAACGEVPVGCIITHEGEVVGRGQNRRESCQNALLHAEIEAINEACNTLGRWRLNDCNMYVTLEPCPMCSGAIINSRLHKVFYGAKDEKAGACGSVLNIFEERFNHKPQLVGGVLKDECSALLSSFFASLRNK